MANPTLVLPGVLFVGDDDRARLVAHTGPAAGWLVPRGIGTWSDELSVVAREDLTDEIRAATKAVMPEEQIPPARMPLTLKAAQASPLVGVASKLAPKLVEAGVRVHTIGVDHITSSFYYLAEGGGEEPARVEGDLVQAVGAMLGERADNAAIERVLDGLADRLLRALSRGRVTELSLELAAALPRAASDGTGAQDVDLEGFERTLAKLVSDSEKYTSQLRQIGVDLEGTNERRLEIPLFVDARKVSQGPFDLTIGEQRVSLPTSERWVLSGPFAPPGTSPKPAPVAPERGSVAPPRPGSTPPPKPVAKVAAAEAKPLDAEDALLAKLEEKVIAADESASKSAPPEPKPEVKPEEPKPEVKPEEPKPEVKPEEPKPEEPKPEEPKPEEPKPEEPKPAPKKAESKKAESDKKADGKKAESKKADAKKAESQKAGDKKAAPIDKRKVDTVRVRKAESQTSVSTWIALLVALGVAAWVAWRFWLAKP